MRIENFVVFNQKSIRGRQMTTDKRFSILFVFSSTVTVSNADQNKCYNIQC